MTRKLALGIDVSTAEVRVTVVDVDFAIQVANGAVPLPAVTGEAGVREQDADYARLSLDLIAGTLAALDDIEVAAISITATSGTVVLVGVDGGQRGPGVMYDDARGLPFERSLTRVTGRPTSMLGRIMSVAAAGDDSRVASVAQVIGTALVGRPVDGDTSHFLKTGIDPARTEWPHDLLADARLRPSVLPTLVQPGAILGTVAVGPASGAVLIAGMTDGCTSQLASGAVRDGQSVGVLGTTLVLKSVSATDRWDAATGVYAHRSPDGRYWLGGASNVGGGSVPKPAAMGYAEIERLARAAGPSPVVRYPLARRGERFPVADPDLDEFTVDLAGATATEVDPVVAYRAGLEGVAMVERFALETLGLDPRASERILSGGGTRNRLWNELRAATLGTVVRIPKHGESAYGAAVLAAWGGADESFADEVARFTGGQQRVHPDPDLVAAMDERYAVFRRALGDRAALAMAK
jgi:xylulokinase